MSSARLFWFAGRSTPVVAPSAKEARSRAKAGGGGKVVASRLPTAEEWKKIRKGTWIRARPPGTSQTSSSGPSRFRPALRAKAKGRPVS